MRLITLLATTTTLVLFAVIAHAENDLDSLLGELSFAGSQLVSDDEDDLLGDDIAQDLLPPPSLQSDPAGPVKPSQQPTADATPLPANAALPPASPPAPQTPPAPILVPNQPTQPVTGNPSLAPAQMSTAHGDSHRRGCGCASCQQQTVHHQGPMPAPATYADHHARHRQAGSCDGDGSLSGKLGYECRPHVRPNLPPPSTMLQYFRSRNVNSNIWAGYAAEAQQRDDSYGQHANGQCDCHLKSKEKHCLLNCQPPPLYRAAKAPPCPVGCDAGACHCGSH